ncbi:MAG: right-handed parallel beta-helix repeat-containing protein, partial [Planctomycetota bacterium]
MQRYALHIVVLCTMSGVAEAATLNVPADEPTIQAAIDVAAAGDQIVVAPGVYQETIDFGGKAIVVSSTAGALATTIDASGLDASVVTFANGEGPKSLLEGFTLTGGTGTDTGGSRRGGGIYCSDASPTIRECALVGNTADLGGGMYVTGGGPNIVRCDFTDNIAGDRGGGLRAGNASTGAIVECLFAGNSAVVGGGMAVAEASTPVIFKAHFLENAAINGAGMANESCAPELLLCLFELNDAENLGGGMANINAGVVRLADCTFTQNTAMLGGGVGNDRSHPHLTGCLFVKNNADLRGGGMHVNDGAPMIERCIFGRNTAGGFGGAIGVLAGRPVIRHTSLAGNTATIGGGVSAESSSLVELVNCTLHANSALSGGGVESNASTVLLTNCIVWANSGGAVAGPTAVSHSDVDEPVAGPGNLGADPKFADALGPDGLPGTADDDLRLKTGSPCIDAADNTARLGMAGLDLGHAARHVDDLTVADTGVSDGFRAPIDMGAYEFGSEDCNRNDVIDTVELAEDADFNGVPDECESDCNGNGTPDASELLDGLSADCNDNGLPDECETNASDCNGNAIPDECDLLDGLIGDCNANGLPDDCDLAGGAADCDGNGVLDECELVEGDCDGN